ncbi:hypothetical protein [Streptomyces europaeiscabiei]|nr:hypothetical protein [Streptomyces europaeiscabiei]MDX3581302.1 hypothetical protein [Streptomyces europaeiscabiei]
MRARPAREGRAAIADEAGPALVRLAAARPVTAQQLIAVRAPEPAGAA